MINFNEPPYMEKSMDYIRKAVENKKICGDGEYTKKCNAWLEEHTGTKKALLTTSCTHATELAAILSEIKPGDEVIMPAYTFVSTADAFVLRGAKAVFVDIRPDTMNINEKLIEQAITEKTKAIVPVHYAGVACEMDTIMDIARRHNLKVVEDAAEQSLANDDSSQTNDDRATAHADICKALILAQQRAGQGHQTVGDSQTQHHIEAGVDALCAGHGGVGAGGTAAAAQLATEEPVQHPDECRRDEDDHHDGVVQGKFLDPAQREEQVVLVHVDGLVGLAHDLQVDGVEGQLGQNTSQNGRYAHKGVEQAGDKAGGQTGQQSDEKRCPDVHAGEQAHNADRAAGAKGTVYGQVSHIQDAVSQVHTNGHDAPDEALRTGTGQGTGQVSKSCKNIQNVFLL